MRNWVLAAVGSLLFTGACYGQIPASDTAIVRGKVVDPNQAAIEGAEVIAVADERRYSTRTNLHGEFSINLEPGKYSFRINAIGFSEAVRIVEIKQTGVEYLDLMLPVAGSNDIVTITEPAEYQTESVISATKTLTPLRDIPQSITVVGSEQIRDQSLQSIADVVNYVPGVSSHQGENNRDQLVIRGNSTSADFYLNGVRDDVQYYRDLYNVERLEVLKGPNAMIFGRGGGGGVVNRVSKEAGFSSLREFSFQGGSYNNKRLTMDLDQPFSDQIAFRFNTLYENSGSFRDHVSLQRYGFNPTLTLAAGSNTKLTLSYEHFHDGRTADRGVPSFQGRPIGVPIFTYFGDPDNSQVRARVDLVAGSLE
jgi:catecholate siderophore receptor